MEKQEIEQALQELQAKLVNVKIFVAVPMGVLMILYFFTYATLIDRGLMGMLYLELVTTVAFLFALIYLNPLGFRLLNWRYRRHPRFGPLLAVLTAELMNQLPERLSDEVARRLQQI